MPAAAPLPAATVLMLRPGAGDLEVFMVVRHHQIDFASGALVFPGGKVAAGDGSEVVRARSRGAAEDNAAFALQAAAIREAFEECGVLLARPAGTDSLVDAARLAELEHWREPLERGAVPLGDFLAEEDLELACDHLVHFAHWVTPAMMPKRFDTHFFLALAPPDHLAVHDGRESVDSVWIAPQAALDAADAGQHTVIFPTACNLQKLARHRDPGAALEAAAVQPVVTVEPWTEQRDGQMHLCIPPEAGYPVSAAPFDPSAR